MGRRIGCNREISLLDLAHLAGVGIEAACGGNGRCGTCKVEVKGRVTPPGEKELALLAGAETGNLRLACRTRALGSLTVWVPEASRLHRQVILTGGEGSEVELDTSLSVFHLDVSRETGAAVTADRERMLAALSRAAGKDETLSWSTPLSVLQDLGKILDSNEEKISATVCEPATVVSLAPDRGQPVLGLAVDLGTTTIVAYLLDVDSGKPLSVQAAVNPQVSHGEDVISRISLCVKEDGGTALLSGLARECINTLARRACNEAGAQSERVFPSVIVGNPSMIQILMGVDPVRLGRAPFVPAVSGGPELRARELGLQFSPEAVVSFLPLKAGFFGADAVAAALAQGADRVREPTLIADLGTNGELILATGDRMLCCSTAAGPAFEGGQIQWGMRAAPGAVDDVRVSPADLQPHLSVIGGRRPLGILRFRVGEA